MSLGLNGYDFASLFFFLDAQSESATTSKLVQGLPKHIKELRDLEDKLGHTAQDTIQAYHAVVCAIKGEFLLLFIQI